MTPERLKEISRSYRLARDNVDDVLSNALCETYRAVTGKQAPDRLREAFAEAVRYHAA